MFGNLLLGLLLSSTAQADDSLWEFLNSEKKKTKKVQKKTKKVIVTPPKNKIQQPTKTETKVIVVEKERRPSLLERVSRVDKRTFDLPMVYNDEVLYWVEWYSDSERRQFLRWNQNSGEYRDMIVSELKRAKLPRDLLYVAMIESGFTDSRSQSAQKIGLWGLTPSLARTLGLRVDSLIDERRDPYRSTTAAITLLKKLHSEFGYWHAALAAYSTGEKTLHNIIIDNGTADFWTLSDADALPEETKDYIPKILAAAIIDRNPSLFDFSYHDRKAALSYAAIELSGSGQTVESLAAAAGLAQSDFQEANPHLQGLALPNDDSQIRLYLPPENHNKLSQNLGTNEPSPYVSGGRLSDAEFRKIRQPKQSLHHHSRRHLVKQGETLESISQKRNIAPEKLRQWNNIAKSQLPKVGSFLRLTPPPPRKWLVHQCKKGERLKTIARKYGVSLEDIYQWNGIEKTSKLSEGQRIYIKPK